MSSDQISKEICFAFLDKIAEHFFSEYKVITKGSGNSWAANFS